MIIIIFLDWVGSSFGKGEIDKTLLFDIFGNAFRGILDGDSTRYDHPGVQVEGMTRKLDLPTIS